MDDIGSKVVDSRNKVVDKKGNIRYFNEEGKLHSEGGRPSIEWRDGSKQWHANGKQHRDGGLPAVEHIDGSKSWWVDNERHRDGGLPAVVRADGRKEWYRYGRHLTSSE